MKYVEISYRRALILILLILIPFVFYTCGESNPSRPEISSTTNNNDSTTTTDDNTVSGDLYYFTGSIFDDNGIPVYNAKVELSNIGTPSKSPQYRRLSPKRFASQSTNNTTTTDESGIYEISLNSESGYELILTVSKSGFTSFQKRFAATSDTIIILGKTNLKRVGSIKKVTATQSATVSAKAGADTLVKVNFKANSIMDTANNSVTGDVTITVTSADASDTNDQEIFPGNYMAGDTMTVDADTMLESIAFVEISVTDAQGNDISNIDPENPAEVILKLPDNLQSKYNAGDSIGWWSYDEETAKWIQEGYAEVIEEDGILYSKGLVTHFSWWNCDEPVNEHATLGVKIVDGSDNPLEGISVYARGVSYNGISSPCITDDSGMAYLTIKRTTDSNSPESVKLYAESGNYKFYYDVKDATEGDTVLDSLTSPAAVCSALRNINFPANVKYLTNSIKISFEGRITGKVTDRSGVPKSNYRIVTNIGKPVITDNNGNYTVEVPLNMDIEIIAIGFTTRKIRLTDTNTAQTVNFQLDNRSPKIKSLVADTNIVQLGNTINISALVSDDDNDNISYVWSANKGSINNTNNKTTAWTAPNQKGTYYITLTVSDGFGGYDTATIPVLAGNFITSQEFKLTVKDNPYNDTPIQNVLVIVYNSDNTIYDAKYTDVNGMVDFGNIGRTEVSFAVYRERQTDYIEPLLNKSTDLDIDRELEKHLFTVVDVPTGDILFYISPFYYYMGLRIAGILDNTTLKITNFDYDTDYNSVNVQPYLSNSNRNYFNDYAIYNGNIGQEDLQDDGKLSFLAYQEIRSYNTETGYHNYFAKKYGYSLDNNPADIINDTLIISLDYTPLDITYSVNRASVDIDITGYRKGIPYNLSRTGKFDNNSNYYGKLQFFTFPCDYYNVIVYGGSNNNNDKFYYQKKLSNIPSYLDIEIPGYPEPDFTMSFNSDGSLQTNVTNKTDYYQFGILYAYDYDDNYNYNSNDYYNIVKNETDLITNSVGTFLINELYFDGNISNTEPIMLHYLIYPNFNPDFDKWDYDNYSYDNYKIISVSVYTNTYKGILSGLLNDTGSFISYYLTSVNDTDTILIYGSIGQSSYFSVPNYYSSAYISSDTEISSEILVLCDINNNSINIPTAVPDNTINFEDLLQYDTNTSSWDRPLMYCFHSDILTDFNDYWIKSQGGLEIFSNSEEILWYFYWMQDNISNSNNAPKYSAPKKSSDKKSFSKNDDKHYKDMIKRLSSHLPFSRH